MANIQDLMLDANDSGSNEYKEGWNNAICYLNDNYCITTRAGEPISITFDVGFNEDDLIDKIKKVVQNGK